MPLFAGRLALSALSAVFAGETVWLVLAQVGSGDDPAPVTFINYGVLGAVLILLMTGQFRHKREVEEVKDRLTQVVAANDKYQTIYERDVIPMLQKAVSALDDQQREVVPLLQRTTSALDALNRRG